MSAMGGRRTLRRVGLTAEGGHEPLKKLRQIFVVCLKPHLPDNGPIRTLDAEIAQPNFPECEMTRQAALGPIDIQVAAARELAVDAARGGPGCFARSQSRQ